MNFTKEQLNEIHETVRRAVLYNSEGSSKDVADIVVKNLTPDPAVERLLLSGYSGKIGHAPGTVWLDRSAVEAIVAAVDQERGR